MTKPYSLPNDNGGLCESCNRPETRDVGQTAYPLKMADGSGGWEWGTMWLCPDCLKQHQDRDKGEVTR